MAIHKTEAIVLKAVKFRDTSYITTFFTRDFGKLKALSKGIRKERSSQISHYEPFSYLRLVFYEKSKSDIHFISESSLEYYFPKLRADFEKICWASYLLELVDVIHPLYEKNEGLFELLLDILHRMEIEPASRLSCVFAIKLLFESGFFPNLGGCLRCQETQLNDYFSLREGGLFCEKCRSSEGDAFFVSKGLIKSIQFFAENDFSRNLQLKVSREMEEELHRMIYRWVRYRFDQELATMGFLQEVQLLQST